MYSREKVSEASLLVREFKLPTHIPERFPTRFHTLNPQKPDLRIRIRSRLVSARFDCHRAVALAALWCEHHNPSIYVEYEF